MWGESILILASSYTSAIVKPSLLLKLQEQLSYARPCNQREDSTTPSAQKFIHRLFLNQEMLLEVRSFYSHSNYLRKNRQKPQHRPK